MDDEFYNVEEAAAAAAVSVATMRRRCASGEVEAEKVGRNWIIKRDSVAAKQRTTRRVAQQNTRLDFDASLRHLRALDAKDLWVPDVLNFEDILGSPTAFVKEANERISNLGPFDIPVDVDHPKNPFFTRAAALLTFTDRLAYHACVLSIVDAIEAARLSSVYSSVRSDDPDRLFVSGHRQHSRWRNAVRSSVTQGNHWVIETDVVAYFDNIQLKLLADDIESMGPDRPIKNALMRMLNEWSGHRGLGVPQGPDASRALGNLYLYPVDRQMHGEPVGYFRYMDDIRIAAPTRKAAVDGLRVLEKALRNRGLTLSATKTNMLSGADAIKKLWDEDLTEAEYWTNLRHLRKASELLKKIFRSSIKRDGNVVVRRLRFSLWRLRTLRDASVLNAVLRNLEQFSPVASLVAEYLRPWIARKSFEARLTDFLLDDDRNTSQFLSVWILAVMLDHAGPLPAPWIDYARSICQDANEPEYHRTIAANVMALGREQLDIEWLRRQIRSEHNPALVRAYLVALARVHQATKNDASVAVGRFPELACTKLYLVGRTTLPSLIVHGEFIHL